MVTVGRTSPPQVAKPEAGKHRDQHGEDGEQHDAGPEVRHRLAGDGAATLAPSSRPVSARRAIHTPSGIATTAVSRIAAMARVIV